MATITSTATGNWSAGATWTGGVAPGDGDTADIQNTHTVTVDTDITVGPDNGGDPNPEADCSIIVRNGGTLDFKHATITLSLKGPIKVEDGGEFLIGSSGSPISSGDTITIDHVGTSGWKHWIAGKMAAYGYEAYHMADEDSQRTRLAADTASGAGVTITVQDPVDWETGDSLWFGTGGDPEHAATGCEKASITGKTSTTEYTIDSLGSNHYGGSTYGDVVIHASRNVIFKGTNGQGFNFTTREDSSYANPDAELYFYWCRFEYAGRGSNDEQSVFYLGSDNWLTANDHIYKTDGIQIQNCAYDTQGVSDSCWVGIEQYAPSIESAQSSIRNNHLFDFHTAIRYYSQGWGIFRIGHLSILEANDYGIDGSTEAQAGPVDIDGYIYISDSSDGVVTRRGSNDMPCRLTNFWFHRGYDALAIDERTGVYVASYHGDINGGEIFHVQHDGITILTGNVHSWNITVSDCKFYDIERNGFKSLDDEGYDISFIDCSFDKCNQSNHSARGAIKFNDTIHPGKVRVSGCTFGTDVQNKYWNIFIDGTNDYYGGPLRVLCENCTFKIPDGFSPTATFDWINPPDKRFMWSIGLDHVQDWRIRNRAREQNSFELVKCQLLDATDTDKWDTEYPNTDRIGIVDGGGEIHKVNSSDEPGGYIDGTVARKLLPFNPVKRSHMNISVPIKIPLSSGESISLSVQMKKNVSQATWRLPRVHMIGCGINTYGTMTDVNNSWDTLIVSGTASYSGVVHVWFSCFGVPDLFTSGTPTRTYNGDFWWAYPINPGGTGDDSGAQNIILYVDGLSVSIT